MSPVVPDGTTGATPLGKMKFETTSTEVSDLFLGMTSGSVGETCTLLILLGGGYLAARNFLQWRIPAGVFLGAGVLSALVHLVDDSYPGPWFTLCSGGLALGAMYMATDMVTSPVTRTGSWVFGIGIGMLVVVIRFWGGLAEGVMYSILLMNALVPFLDRATQPRLFGRDGSERGHGRERSRAAQSRFRICARRGRRASGRRRRAGCGPREWRCSWKRCRSRAATHPFAEVDRDTRRGRRIGRVAARVRPTRQRRPPFVAIRSRHGGGHSRSRAGSGELARAVPARWAAQ